MFRSLKLYFRFEFIRSCRNLRVYIVQALYFNKETWLLKSTTNQRANRLYLARDVLKIWAWCSDCRRRRRKILIEILKQHALKYFRLLKLYFRFGFIRSYRKSRVYIVQKLHFNKETWLLKSTTNQRANRRYLAREVLKLWAWCSDCRRRRRKILIESLKQHAFKMFPKKGQKNLISILRIRTLQRNFGWKGCQT